MCVKKALVARVVQVNHNEGHQNSRAARPSPRTPGFPTRTSLSAPDRVCFSLVNSNPSVFYHPLRTMKIHLLCTVLQRFSSAFCSIQRILQTIQDKIDMSDNKFLLMTKESISAESAYVSDERLGGEG